jgi:glycine/D-amino acid oxidase-like deaminating enzyme
MTARSISQLPLDDNSNGWSGILETRQPNAPLVGEQNADWVVLGAGFAGLAAARRLAENRPQDRIILLEANEVGEGASGRNSGFAIDLPHNVGSSMAELEGSHRYMALARAAIEYHEKQIDKYNIQCDWSQPGKYHAAVTGQGAHEVLEPFAEELKALGEPFQWIDKENLDKRLGTRHFNAAVHTPGCRTMNPAALTRGLADNLPENVFLHENSAVVGFEQAGGIRLTTAKGRLSAPKMILCVNGFADRFGFYPRKLLTFAANASLSRRLTSEEHSALACEKNWALTPVNAFAGITMRYTNDHRLLIRQNIYFNPAMRESEVHRTRIKASHKNLFDQRFPMLPDVNMEYTWTGYICLSQNGSPGFGQIAPDVYASVCQNAVGVTKGTIGGLLAADMACNQDNELIGYMQSLGQPDRVPPRPFLDLGVRAKFAWEIWKSRAEA